MSKWSRCSRIEWWDKKYEEIMEKWKNREISLHDGAMELSQLGVTVQKAKEILQRT